MITTQKELRRVFREYHPDLDFRKIKTIPAMAQCTKPTRVAHG